MKEHEFCVTYICSKGAIKKHYMKAETTRDAINFVVNNLEHKSILSTLLC